MIYHAVTHSFSHLPCKWYCLMALLFSAGSFVSAEVINSIIGAISGLILSVIALMGAIRASRRQEGIEARKDMLQQAKLEAQLEKFRQGTIEPLQRRGELHEAGLKHIRNKQVKIEQSLKGIEDLYKIGLLVGPNPGVPSILIVDDDPTWVNQMARFFGNNLGPFNLLQALTVEDGIREVQKGPQYLFLDLKINDRSGLEIIPEAKAANPHCCIIVITGWNDPEELQGANLLGAQVWRKPIQIEDLNKIVRDMRGHYGVPRPSSEEIPVSLNTSLIGQSLMAPARLPPTPPPP